METDSKAGGVFWFILAVLSLVALVMGFNYLTQITLGVGIITAGCGLGILARIVQAEVHHRGER